MLSCYDTIGRYFFLAYNFREFRELQKYIVKNSLYSIINFYLRPLLSLLWKEIQGVGRIYKMRGQVNHRRVWGSFSRKILKLSVQYSAILAH